MLDYLVELFATPIMRRIERLENRMSAQTDAILAEVEKNRAVTQSAKLLLTRLVALVEQNKADPVALDKILADIKADSDDLSAAVAANTPADPNPAPTP